MRRFSLSSMMPCVDAWWTRAEVATACAVLALECGALGLWVLLKGLSTPVGSESMAGWVTRATLAAIGLGSIGYFGLRSRPRWRVAAALAGCFLGVASARAWLSFPVDYASNLLNWLQQASTLTLFGGLRGVATRLTILLLLVGASIATSSARHITIDLVARVMPRGLARYALVLNALFASVVCGAAGWGFFDHVSIETFGAEPEAAPRKKAASVIDGVAEHAFILRKQMQLDARSFGPVVLAGRSYASVLSGREWNRWVADAGFTERYGSDRTGTLTVPPEQSKAPMVVVPGLGEPRGELAQSANLIFPLGLWLVALRFLMQALGVLGSPQGRVESNVLESISG